jgi:hypothetical protein
MIFKCSKCDGDIDETQQVLWQRVTGWEKKRKGGGLNRLALRKELYEFCCNTCMTHMLNNESLGQMPLFDGAQQHAD